MLVETALAHLQTLFDETLAALTPHRDEDPICVAVSGGSDSLALLFLASDWAKMHGRTLHVLTVNHGLRVEATDEVAFVCDVASSLGWPSTPLIWRENNMVQKPSQAVARDGPS